MIKQWKKRSNCESEIRKLPGAKLYDSQVLIGDALCRECGKF